jgi:hypothetical protein
MNQEIYLSVVCSALENIRRLAEYGQLGTHKLYSIHKQMQEHPAEEIRVCCIAAIVGLVGLGILLVCTTSVLGGGIVILAATIPSGISHKYVAQMQRLQNQFEAEGKGDVKNIFYQMILFLGQVTEQRYDEMCKEWNNGGIVSLSSLRTRQHMEEMITEEFRQALLQFDRQNSLVVKHNHTTVQTSYEELRAYILKISIVISTQVPKKDESNIFLRLQQTDNPFHDLQEMCTTVLEKSKLALLTEVRDKAEISSELLTNPKGKYYRQFHYTEQQVHEGEGPDPIEKVMIGHLEFQDDD